MIFKFFYMVSLEEFWEIFVAPLFLSESIFILNINQPIKVDSIDQKYRIYMIVVTTSLFDCTSHFSVFMHELNCKLLLGINLVRLIIKIQEVSLLVCSILNFDNLVHMLD